MKKCLKFNETIVDMDTLIGFIKDKEYEVVFENEEYYQLTEQHNTPCGIEKSLEGVMYVAVEKEVEL